MCCQQCPETDRNKHNRRAFLDREGPRREEWVGEVAVCVSLLTSLIPFLLLVFPDSSVREGPSLVCFLAACAVNLALQ